MALDVKILTFTPLETAGIQTHAIGFQPKLIGHLYGRNPTQPVTAARWNHGYSWSTGTPTRSVYSRGSGANATLRGIHSTSKLIRLADEDDLAVQEAGFDSFTATEYKINWSTTTTGLNSIGGLALGGADLSNVFVGSRALPTTTGNFTITGVGFQPNLFLFFMARLTTTEDDASGSVLGDIVPLVGAYDGTSSFYVCASEDQGASTSQTIRRRQTGKCLGALDPTNGGALFEAAPVSMDTDGGTFNLTTAPASAYYVFFLALKGPSVKIGNFNINQTTGNQAVSGIGFTTKALLLYHHGDTSAVGESAHGTHGAGMAVSSTERWALFNRSEDAIAANYDRDFRQSNALCITSIADGGTVIETEADYVSADSNSFTIDVSDVDAARQRVFDFIALGDAAGTPVSQTFAGSHEALDSTATARGGSQEASGPVTSVKAGTHEAIDAITSTRAGMHEGLDSITSTSAGGHEALDTVALAAAGTHAATGSVASAKASTHEGLATTSSSRAGAQEAMATAATTRAGTQEATDQVLSQSAGAQEAAGSAAATRAGQHEAKSEPAAARDGVHEYVSITAASRQGSHEATTPAAATGAGTHEARGSTARSFSGTHESRPGPAKEVIRLDLEVSRQATLDLAVSRQVSLDLEMS